MRHVLLCLAVAFSVGGFLFTPHAHASVFYVHSDHQGSVSLITDTQGQVVDREVYYPFGSPRAVTPRSLGEVGLITDRAYTSQVSDLPDTGLYYYNARYYSPSLGKFTQADTVSDGLNRYAYVGNNPVNLVDPSGHDAGPKGTGGYQVTGAPCTNCHQPPPPPEPKEVTRGECLFGCHNSSGSPYTSGNPMSIEGQKTMADVVLLTYGVMAAPLAGPILAPAINPIQLANVSFKAFAAIQAADAGVDVVGCVGGDVTSCMAIPADLLDMDINPMTFASNANGFFKPPTYKSNNNQQLIIDPKKDIPLSHHVQGLKNYVKFNRTNGSTSRGQYVFDYIRSHMGYSKTYQQQIYRQYHNKAPLGAFVKCGFGVCREMGALAHVDSSSLGLESWMVKGIFTGGDGNHAWSEYVSGNGTLMVIDPAGGYFGPKSGYYQHIQDTWNTSVTREIRYQFVKPSR